MTEMLDLYRYLQDGWSTWRPLEGCWLEAHTPAVPGLYRIRIVISFHGRAFPSIVYIGQSGNLRTRMSHFKGVFGPGMPFKSPHIAGPPLWAIRQRLRQERVPAWFEVSILDLREIPKSSRLGYECVAIACQRQEYPGRFLANFGRMPIGYTASSFNKGDAKSFRGYPSPRRNPSHFPSSIPPGDLKRAPPDSRTWCGHQWTEWLSATGADPSKGESGLYRIRLPGQAGLLYLGQGSLRERIAPYRRVEAAQCSWVRGGWREHERLELLNDLIASHILFFQHAPSQQFTDDTSE